MNLSEYLKTQSRETLLKIGAGTCFGLLVFNYLILNPAIESWSAQSVRIAALQKKVNEGSQLLSRKDALNRRWSEMLRTDLPDDNSAAESDVLKAISRATNASHTVLTNLTPSLQSHDEGYDTYECRVAVTGDQLSLARMLYEVETDASVPARVERCELTQRDPKGQQLNMAATFTFVRINESANVAAANTRTTAR